MATANAKPSTARRGPAGSLQRRRRWPWLVLALMVLIGAAIAWYWDDIAGYARTGTSYGARVACSCRYEGGRPLADCRKDFEPGMGLVTLSEDAEAKAVTARIPLVAAQTATYREGWGCVLQPWK